MREEHGREAMGEAVRRELAERLRSVEAARVSDAQEHSRSLAAAETQLEEERAHRTRAEGRAKQLEANLANQEAGRQAMEGALNGNFLALFSFSRVCSVILQCCDVTCRDD